MVFLSGGRHHSMCRAASVSTEEKGSTPTELTIYWELTRSGGKREITKQSNTAIRIFHSYTWYEHN